MRPQADRDWMLFAIGCYFMASGVIQMIGLFLQVRSDMRRKREQIQTRK